MEKLKEFWGKSNTNKLVVVAIGLGVAYAGYTIYKKKIKK